VTSSLLLAALLAACGAPAEPGAWEPVAPLPPVPPLVQSEPSPGVTRLLTGLPDAALEGEASRMVDEPPTVTRTTLLAADFQDGLGLFAPFFGIDREQASGQVALDDGSLLLSGRAPHGVSVRSGQVPVRSGRVYLLRYRVRAEDLPEKRKGVVAAASLVGWGKGRRMGVIPGLRVPPARAGDWTDVEVRFRVPDWADAVELSLDLGRPLSDRGDYRTRGEVRFDDVELVEEDGPVFGFFAGGNRRVEHPLAGRATLRGESGGPSAETRSVLWAPAPSTLVFEVALPERPVLRLGSGLLPDIGGGYGSVQFTVEVEQDGEATLVESWSVPARTRQWMDRELDLAPWAGRTVRLRLVTTARGRTRGSPGDVSARGAVWSDPEIVDAAGRGRRVVLVGIDTLSAIRTGPWGHPAGATPELERIAAAGTRYARAWSPSPWTLPAFGSLLTGVGPGQHGAGGPLPGSRANRAPLPPSSITLAERLAAAGWSTRAWINNPFLTRAFGTDQGFDRHDDYGTRSKPGAADGAVEAATAWLAAPGADDRFAFVHLMEPHGPYRPVETSLARFAPPPESGPLADGMSHSELVDLAAGRLVLDHADKAQVARLHDAVIADADRAVGQLFDVTRESASEGGLLFAVVADHGEELWDHDGFEHGHAAWDELVRVPLLVVDGAEPGRVVDAPVSTAALAPTILDFAGLDGWEGDALPDSRLPVLGGRSLYGPDRWYAWAGGHKLVLEVDDAAPGSRSARIPDGMALFDMEADPGERRDLLRSTLEPRSADAVRAAWRLLAPELAATLGDHWVIAWTPGADSARGLSGRIELDRGALPGPRRRFGWPDGDGVPTRVTARSKGEQRLAFELPAAGGVLAIPARDAAEEGIRLALDAPPDGVEAELTLSRGDLVDLPAFLREAAASSPRLRVGLQPGAAVSQDIDPSVLDQLRSLGYVE